MGRFTKAMKRRAAREVPKAKREAFRRTVEKAESEVFAYLERRWPDELAPAGGKIPQAMKDDMKTNPVFQALVQRRLEGDPFVNDDRDHTPDVERTLDGKDVSHRMMDELGDDPARYVCPDCGEQQPEPLEGPCEECKAHFRQTE